MLQALRRLLGAGPDNPHVVRAHIAADWPAAIYAIGDVHGCLNQMRGLEAKIVEDGRSLSGEKWLVYLGDYIDRGPDSAGVIDRLISPAPDGIRRICLAGNHEVMALNFLKDPRPGSDWLDFGGQECLQSYGLSAATLTGRSSRSRMAMIESHIPREHISFLEQLPLTLSVPGYVFVHAGLRPGIPLLQQHEDDLLWIRDDFFDAPPHNGLTIVHGHTPAIEPVIAPGRICVDTGAFATGKLTAIRLIQGESPLFLSMHNAQ